MCYSDYESLETWDMFKIFSSVVFLKGKIFRWLWNNNINEAQINELTPQGYKDSQEIGARFKQKYPDLFKDYDPHYYYVSITNRLLECKFQIKQLYN